MRNKFISLSCALLLVTLLFSCSTNKPSGYWPTTEWRTVTPRKAAIRAEMPKSVDAYIQGSLPNTSSVLVVRNGFIVMEKYYEGDAKTKWNLFSVTKSFTSALVGVCIGLGYLPNVDAKMIDLVPQNKAALLDDRVSRVTLRHLLTMSDAIRCSFNPNLEVFLEEEKLFKPIQTEPGKAFNYNELSPRMISIAITRVSQMKAIDLARKFLFAPMGIEEVEWFDYPKGYSDGALKLMLTSRDIAKFGYLYLKNGLWDGQQLVPRDWILESTKSQIATRDFRKYWKEYGYFWWIYNFGLYQAYYAFGSGGQMICVVPELSLIVVMTSSQVEDTNPQGYLRLVDEYIIKAIKK